MKILYACHQFFPEYYTGTERYTLELAKQMQKMGHQVSILTYATKAVSAKVSPGRTVARKNYEYEGVPVTALRHVNFEKRGGLPSVSFQAQDPEIYQEVERFLEEHPFDLLHCTHPMRVGETIRAAKRKELKVVLHLTDYWLLCPRATLQKIDGTLCEGPDKGQNCALFCYGPHMAHRLLERYDDVQDLLVRADAILSPSQFLIDVFKKGGVDTRRFVYSPHGFEYTKVKFAKWGCNGKGTINFGFVGTILFHKGVHVLIEAFKKVPLANIRLKIHGGYFHEDEYYSRLLSAAEGDPRIEFCGEYDFNHIAEVLREIDVVVVPSIWYENAPLAIATVQAFGIPVIATGIGGMAEMVREGVNGYTFKLGDVEELADKIRLIATQPELLKELSRNKIPPPRIEAEAFLLHTLYASLIEERRGVEI